MITAILFTDLVDVSATTSRVAPDAFRAHRRLLSEAVRVNGGREVKWLGDGLMVTFSSVSDALQSAVALQQAARWPVEGLRLGIRVGLDVGETLRENRDHFGTSVVIARRLCDRAESGQILCSALVAELLGRRRAFRFQQCGTVSIDGLAAPVDACEVLYEDERGRGAPRRRSTLAVRVKEPTDDAGTSSPGPTHLPDTVTALRGAKGWAARFFNRLLWIRNRSLC